MADGRMRFRFIVRALEQHDLPAVCAIYAAHVLRGRGSFEEVPPSTEEIGRRYDNVRARGLPWLVAESEGQVIGYSYASPYHARSAYRFTVQSSTYTHEEFHRRGVGRSLLGGILEACTELGYRQVMAAIGDSHNEACIRFHAVLGFRTIGHALRVGVKHGRWVDVVYMQRAIGDASRFPPATDPIGYVHPADQTGP